MAVEWGGGGECGAGVANAGPGRVAGHGSHEVLPCWLRQGLWMLHRGLWVLRRGLWESRQGLWESRQGFWRGMGQGGRSGAWVATRHLQCWGDGGGGRGWGETGPRADAWRNSEAVVMRVEQEAEAELVVVLRVTTAWWGGIWSSRSGVVVVENLHG
ncbi:hypothetical protein EDB89DRAFT_1912428 [Lactarius sanguifluus]|nr:hypothetical protein EDB89DRAFT_1912428 [Lactarius sanguifluus]